MSADVVSKVCGVQKILAVAYGYVDCIARTQGENTRDSGRNADCSLTAERDVWSASMFQQFNHGTKVMGFGCGYVLTLEKRELIDDWSFTAMRGWRTIFSCRLAEHLAEDII